MTVNPKLVSKNGNHTGTNKEEKNTDDVIFCCLARHFINDAAQLVQSALHSVTLTNPSLCLDGTNKIVYRARRDESAQDTVSLVSGGGSGHEPSFAAFVGDGLLAASVAGTVFASPSAEQVRNAVMGRVPREKGVCVVVMNYTVCSSLRVVLGSCVDKGPGRRA